MPIQMLFCYRFTLLFINSINSGEISSYLPHKNNTRSNFKYLPLRANKYRGEQSLLTTGEALFNRYLVGNEGCSLPVLKGTVG